MAKLVRVAVIVAAGTASAQYLLPSAGTFVQNLKDTSTSRLDELNTYVNKSTPALSFQSVCFIIHLFPFLNLLFFINFLKGAKVEILG